MTKEEIIKLIDSMKKLILILFVLLFISCDDAPNGMFIVDKHVYVRSRDNIWIHDPDCSRCIELKTINDSIYDTERTDNY